MKPYHPANLKLIPYAGWRVIALAWAGKLLGIQFHVHGIPFGGHRLSLNRELVWDICNRPVTHGLSGLSEGNGG